jgi:hypothetical protein
LTPLFAQAHYRDGEANFPQSTFCIAFFVPHPADVPPDKTLD